MQLSSQHLLLADRTFRSCSNHRPFLSSTSEHPSQHNLYEKHNLLKAYEAVVNGMSVRRAAEEYNVPKSTLYDPLTGKVMFGSDSGPTKYLSNVEEKELVQFLLFGCSSIGFAKPHKQILAIIQSVVHQKAINVTVTNGWWDSFRKKHPSLSLRNPEQLSHVRAVCTSPEAFDHYFDILEEILD